LAFQGNSEDDVSPPQVAEGNWASDGLSMEAASAKPRAAAWSLSVFRRSDGVPQPRPARELTLANCPAI